MTAGEVIAWKTFTKSTEYRWTVDPIHNKPDDLLIHFGGEDGKYAAISGTELSIGSYKGAIPHIGEAMFKVEGKKKFATAEDALTFLIEKGGVVMLAALFREQLGVAH